MLHMAHGEYNNLTGLWQGQFSYLSNRFAPEFFTANLLEGLNFIGGSILEIVVNGKSAGMRFYASVSGKREGSSVIFTKIYETAPRSHQVYYSGTVNDDFTEIEGTWTIRSNWSGRFLMIRNNGQVQGVYMRSVERV
ncbi:MAG: hypothetical protein PHU07_11650 [Acidocella sp.]|nr:hypothetical protein [Acidocella sp.]